MAQAGSMKKITCSILADGASLVEMADMEPLVDGFTTNPSLMRKAGIQHYADFALAALRIAKGKPISFEVLADDFEEMGRQARIIAGWGENVYVKIPVTNSVGDSSVSLIHELSSIGIKLNITAIMERVQVEAVVPALNSKIPSFISIFAGRIADIGIDPVPLMFAMADYVQRSRSKLIWASAREIYNVLQASTCGCHAITLSPTLIRKLPLVGRNPIEHSLETVREFVRDAVGYSL